MTKELPNPFMNMETAVKKPKPPRKPRRKPKEKK